MRYFEDFTVGRLWEYDECYLVTEEEICEVGERWDPQPFHTDPVAAEQRRSRSRPEMGVVSARSELVNHERDLVFSMASASLIMCRPDGA